MKDIYALILFSYFYLVDIVPLDWRVIKSAAIHLVSMVICTE